MPEPEHTFRVRTSAPADLASGRVVADAEEVSLTQEEVQEPHNQGLIERKILVPLEVKNPAPEPSEAAVKKADDLDVEISEVKGTGGTSKNQVTVDDVVAFAEARDSSDPDAHKEGGD